ncbi:MAG: pyridoxamine 5'-phosphate oxidase [Leeuwenhoekiella sp.]
MATDLKNYRKSYEKNTLTMAEANANPFDQFKQWFQEVEEAGGLDEVNAMNVATYGADGFPKNRIVLLKEYDQKGFVFYTNYASEKGQAIVDHPHVCLSFFWANLERQVIIKGIAHKVPAAQSDAYFNSRPKGSQLGALASPQSQVIESREVLQKRLKNLEDEYVNKPVQRPESWGGFLVSPIAFEFWQGRPNRLHDRIRYVPEADCWKKERLAP